MLGLLVSYTPDSELLKINAQENYLDISQTKQATPN
jgi:hypothetical protein